jgi:formylmethanofuran--tetrahydromethanopterin N-formyltransferase
LEIQSIEHATLLGIQAACIPGICRISAGNYGGNLGTFRIYLHKVLKEVAPL